MMSFFNCSLIWTLSHNALSRKKLKVFAIAVVTGGWWMVRMKEGLGGYELFHVVLEAGTNLIKILPQILPDMCNEQPLPSKPVERLTEILENFVKQSMIRGTDRKHKNKVFLTNSNFWGYQSILCFQDA